MNTLERFDKELIELSWSLWQELGVAGSGPRKHEKCLIALEELIILTATIAKSDPRLRDEALDWCSRNHHFVSVSRLKNLVKIFGEPIYESFSIFACTLNSMVKSKWPIFLSVNPLKVNFSGKSISPNCARPSLVGLRMRELFGVGARADLFTFFLMQNENEFSASDIAKIGYNKRSLAELLDQLVQARWVNSSVVGNQKRYSLCHKEELKKLVGEVPLISLQWIDVLKFLLAVRFNLQQDVGVSSQLVLLINALKNLKDSLLVLHLSLPKNNNDILEWLLDIVRRYAQGNFGGDVNVEDRFEKTISSFMQYLYKVIDCIDGLDLIIDCSTRDLIKHGEVFRESYQLFLAYTNDLKFSMKDMLDFPFYEFMDFTFSDMCYQYKKNELEDLFKNIDSLPDLKDIMSPRDAIKQYERFGSVLNKAKNFESQIRSQLQKIWQFRMESHLLTLPTKLYKRHPVIKLFNS